MSQTSHGATTVSPDQHNHRIQQPLGLSSQPFYDRSIFYVNKGECQPRNPSDSQLTYWEYFYKTYIFRLVKTPRMAAPSFTGMVPSSNPGTMRYSSRSVRGRYTNLADLHLSTLEHASLEHTLAVGETTTGNTTDLRRRRKPTADSVRGDGLRSGRPFSG